MKNLFREEELEEIYHKIFREGARSAYAGDMWEPNVRPEDLAKFVNSKIDGAIYKRIEEAKAERHVYSGVTLNEEPLYRKVK